MPIQPNITALRMERQRLVRPAGEAEYDALYRDMQPGQNVYWNGFGDPPSLTCRAEFDDIAYNRLRQQQRELLKLRLAGGNLGWVIREDLALFAGLYRKPLDRPTAVQTDLLNLIGREGPMNIQTMKEMTGLLVKQITPVLHRLQEAFLVYEDQHDGEWDRGWYSFSEMFPGVSLERYPRHDALKIILGRFAFRLVRFDEQQAKSYYKLPGKEIRAALTALTQEGVLAETEGGYVLKSDLELLKSCAPPAADSVFALHRNDFLVKSNEHWLKEKYPHNYPDTLYYLLIDGEFHGAVAGKFRYTPEVEDVILDLPPDMAAARKEDVLAAIRVICPGAQPAKRFMGEEL